MVGRYKRSKPLKAPDKIEQLQNALTGTESSSKKVMRAFVALMNQDSDEEPSADKTRKAGGKKRTLPRR